MAARFSNGQDWFTAIAAMAVWAAHFMLLWTAASVFPGQPAGRWTAVALTLLAAVIAAAGIVFDFAPALIG